MKRRLLLLATALALCACQPAPAGHEGAKGADQDMAGMPGMAAGDPSQTSTPASTPASTPVTVGAITIEQALANPPPGGVTTGAAYMVIRNAGDTPDRLVGASSPQAGPVELHTHREVGGAMRMERVEAVDVPAHGEVIFEPHGLHLMLFNFAPAGAETPVTLKFEKAGEATVTFRVAGR